MLAPPKHRESDALMNQNAEARLGWVWTLLIDPHKPLVKEKPFVWLQPIFDHVGSEFLYWKGESNMRLCLTVLGLGLVSLGTTCVSGLQLQR